jgi:hypothetical protein
MSEVHNVASRRLGLWCNWIFVALTAVGWLGIRIVDDFLITHRLDETAGTSPDT